MFFQEFSCFFDDPTDVGNLIVLIIATVAIISYKIEDISASN